MRSPIESTYQAKSRKKIACIHLPVQAQKTTAPNDRSCAMKSITKNQRIRLAPFFVGILTYCMLSLLTRLYGFFGVRVQSRDILPVCKQILTPPSLVVEGATCRASSDSTPSLNSNRAEGNSGVPTRNMSGPGALTPVTTPSPSNAKSLVVMTISSHTEFSSHPWSVFANVSSSELMLYLLSRKHGPIYAAQQSVDYPHRPYWLEWLAQTAPAEVTRSQLVGRCSKCDQLFPLPSLESHATTCEPGKSCNERSAGSTPPTDSPTSC